MVFLSALLPALLILDSSIHRLFGREIFSFPFDQISASPSSFFRLAFLLPFPPFFHLFSSSLASTVSIVYPSTRGLTNLELNILLSPATCFLPLSQASPRNSIHSFESTKRPRVFLHFLVSFFPQITYDFFAHRFPPFPASSPHMLFTSFIVSLGVGRQGVVFLAGR